MADRGTFPNNATFIANAAMLTSLVVGDTVTIAGEIWKLNGDANDNQYTIEFTAEV